MATFITAQSVGNDISIYVQTSTGYWKYNHDGSDSSVFTDGGQTITVQNANGEFTLIPCDEFGAPSGDIIGTLNASNNQITSFDGTGLPILNELVLNGNNLTTFSGAGLNSLTTLELTNNQLTTFDGSGLLILVNLTLLNNPLTTFILGDLQLSYIDFEGDWFITTLETFDGSTLNSNLGDLSIANNQLTSFDGSGLSNLINLNLSGNQLTSFNKTGLGGLGTLNLSDNQLTSFDVTDLFYLYTLFLGNNQLTSVNLNGLLNIFLVSIAGNPIPAVVNDQILTDLVTNNISEGTLDIGYSPQLQRTTASNANYTTLDMTLNWFINGTYDVVSPPTPGSGKLRIKGALTLSGNTQI